MRRCYPSLLMMVMIKESKKIRSWGLWVLQGNLGVKHGILSGEGTQRLSVRKMCWYVFISHTSLLSTRALLATSSSRNDVGTNLSRVFNTYNFGRRRVFLVFLLASFQYVPPREFDFEVANI